MTITSIAAGSIEAPSLGSRAPNDVTVVGSPGRNERTSRSPPTIRGSPTRTPRATSPSTIGSTGSSEPNEEKAITVCACKDLGQREEPLRDLDRHRRARGRHRSRRARSAHACARRAWRASTPGRSRAERLEDQLESVGRPGGQGDHPRGTGGVDPVAEAPQIVDRAPPDVQRAAARLAVPLQGRQRLGVLADAGRCPPRSAAPRPGPVPPPAPRSRDRRLGPRTPPAASPTRSTRSRPAPPHARPVRMSRRSTPRPRPRAAAGPRSAGSPPRRARARPRNNARSANDVSSSRTVRSSGGGYGRPSTACSALPNLSPSPRPITAGRPLSSDSAADSFARMPKGRYPGRETSTPTPNPGFAAAAAASRVNGSTDAPCGDPGGNRWS